MNNGLFGVLRIPHIDVEEAVVNIPLVESGWDLTHLDDQVGLLEGGGHKPKDTLSMVFVAHVTTAWPIQDEPDQILLVTCDGYDLLNDLFDHRLIAIASLDSIEPYNPPDSIEK